MFPGIMRQWLHEIYNYTLNTCRCRVSFIHWWSKNIKSWGKDSKISTSKRDSTFSIVTKILLNFRVGSALVSWASNSCWSKHGNKPNKAFLIFGWQDLTFWSDISSWSVSGASISEEGFSNKKTAHLPKERMGEETPFIYSGVDFFLFVSGEGWLE